MTDKPPAGASPEPTDSRPASNADPFRRIMLMAGEIAPDQKPFWRLSPAADAKPAPSPKTATG